MCNNLSPCTKVCKIEDGVCIGCKRTLKEIANWSRMTEAERKEVMEMSEEDRGIFERKGV